MLIVPQQARSLLEGKGGDVILYTDEFGKQTGVAHEISLLISQKEISLLMSFEENGPKTHS